MKRKVYYQISIILYMLLAVLLAIFTASVYVVVWFLKDKVFTENVWAWAGFVAAVFAIFFIGYNIIKMAKNRIVLNDKEIYVPEHWGSKDYKLQYETHISYSDIRNIYIVLSNNNSLNEPLKWGTLPMPYIVFDCNSEEQKAVNVFYFSKRQTVKIIDDVILRAKKRGNDLVIGNGEKILKKFLEKRNIFQRKKDNCNKFYF